MQIKHVRLLSFRAHSETELSFGPGVNLIYGPNGAGKTNILEAIHYLALGKSFLVSNDRYALRNGCRFFELEAALSRAARSDARVRLAYVPEEGKKVFVNKSPLEKLSHIVGTLPIVVFAPSDHALTAEGPDVRRRFLNNILSQARPVYLDAILQYRKVLRHRNVLLGTYRRMDQADRGVLEAWNAELVKLGSRIVTSRLQFVEKFKTFMKEAYARIDTVGEYPDITYKTIAPVSELGSYDDVESAFLRRLNQSIDREFDLGRTLVGPHRDELVFRINEMDVRRYASQGQHRTFGIALKLAQFFYLKAELEDIPVLLLDDLFGSLDRVRTETFLELLQTAHVGQSIITAADREIFDNILPFNQEENRAILIEKGKVIEPGE